MWWTTSPSEDVLTKRILSIAAFDPVPALLFTVSQP
jgi:hypothetical protein